jgi:DNA-binding GntR family transcriptional regulator
MRVHHGLLRFVREAARTGAPLPGEIELTARLDCTRQQLRNALTALEADGIVRRRQGSVTTVDPIALRLSVRLEDQFEHSELLDRLGYRSQVETLATSVGEVGAAVGAAMELPAAMPAFHARKRWRADDIVAMVADDLLPLPPAVDGDALSDASVFTTAARVWGEPVIWEVTVPGVAVLDDDLAELFEREPGVPVMTLEIIGIGTSGRRLMHSLEYHDPHVVSYSFVRTVRPPWVGGS